MSEINEQDLAILRFIGEQFVVDDVLLANLRGRSINTNYRWRNRMRESGLIRADAIATDYFGTPYSVWLTAKGMRACGLDYRATRPAPTHLRQNLVIAATRLGVEHRMESQGRSARWICARELLKGGVVRPSTPDAEVVFDSEETVAVKIEITNLRTDRILTTMTALSRSYDAAWYFCSESVYDYLKRKCDKGLQLPDNVQTVNFDREVVDRLVTTN